ncbi:homoaconitase [Trametopsis cervina]|nr:homoaconitase [Trametopsis cervina]
MPPALRLPRRWRAFAPNFARHLATAVEQPRIPQTIIEKVVQKYAVGLPADKVVKAGDYVMIRPEHVMTHDNTGPVISKFQSIGATRIHNPKQIVFTLDHDVQNKSDKNLKKYATIEAFARVHGIDFYPAGRGIGHQVLVEEGYAFPHTLTVASDSHSNMYGGVGCVGTPIVRTDAAALWATGQTWWQVPRMVKVEFKGQLAPGVTGKDVIVALCGSFNQDEVLNAAIEFTGEGISHLSVDDRLTIANMTTEWGALVGVFPVDEVTLQWYDRAVKKMELRTFASSNSSSAIPPPPEHPRINRLRVDAVRARNLRSDPNAEYSSTLVFDLSTLVPYVSGPNSVKVANPLPTLEASRIAINKAYLLSCTNSRASDIAAAAAVLKGRQVAPGVEFYVAAASSEVQQESQLSGDWDVLIGAGAKPLPAGCGPCIGLGTGLLEEGQVGISATNRNYKGRMGHPLAQAYLASPAVVAASAIKGYIAGPDSLDANALPPAGKPTFSIVSSPESSAKPTQKEPVLTGFPTTFSGPLLFAPQDNLNTDGIYPGKYTYQDDITLERQAEVVMENYDPKFAELVASIRTSLSHSGVAGVKSGVVLASGYNFGTGSSREQAATALKSAGVPIVVAGSFGDIFKRNAINNGLVCVESRELISDLTEQFAKDAKRGAGGRDGELTVNKGLSVEVKVVDGVLEVEFPSGERKSYTIQPVGASVQELWLCGGLEGYVLKTIQSANW